MSKIIFIIWIPVRVEEPDSRLKFKDTDLRKSCCCWRMRISLLRDEGPGQRSVKAVEKLLLMDWHLQSFDQIPSVSKTG